MRHSRCGRSGQWRVLLSLFLLFTTVAVCASEVEDCLLALGIDPSNTGVYARGVSLFDYERSAPLLIEEVGRWTEEGVTFIDLTYESPKGGRVPATLAVPPGPGPFAGLVLQHGMPSSRQSKYTLAGAYGRLGAVSIMIDAPFARPVNGERAPVLFTEQDRVDQIQLIVDLQRAVDLLIAREDVDAERLAFIGVSYGGAMGGLLAGVETRLQAYVFVVGGGGLVERHLLIPEGFRTPFDELTEEEQREWIELMWPIEPHHYVSHAAPAALLYQNGEDDLMVIRESAERYQGAGSEPKQIHWYASGHSLPFSHLHDQAVWLHDRIGILDVRSPGLSADLLLMDPVESLMPFFPAIRARAVLLDRVMIAWFATVAISVAWFVIRMLRRTAGSVVREISWGLAATLLGPLALVAHWLTRGEPDPRASAAPARLRTLSAVALSAAGVGLGMALLVALSLCVTQLLEQRILMTALMILLPHAMAALLAVFGRAGARSSFGETGRGRRMADQFAVSGFGLAAGLPILILLIARWLDVWYPMGSWSLATPPLWFTVSIASLAALAGAGLAAAVLGRCGFG